MVMLRSGHCGSTSNPCVEGTDGFILYPLSAIDWGCVMHSKALLAVSGRVDEAF